MRHVGYSQQNNITDHLTFLEVVSRINTILLWFTDW